MPSNDKGVLGRQIELIAPDPQSDNRKFQQLARRLILEDKVDVLMGGFASAEREALRPIMKQTKQLYWYNNQYEGGVADKQTVELEVICPRWAADDDCGARLLAGDFAGTFGGFLDRSIRASDFALGWRAVVEWLPEGLGRQGLGEETIAELLHVLDDAADPAWFSTTVDGDGVDQLSAAGRWRLALLAAQFGRVLVRAAIPSVRLPFGSIGRA